MSLEFSDPQNDEGSLQEDEPFSWLSAHDRGAAYISYSEFTDLPACSFDFGDRGYAASSNNGGDLLQMTARSDKHGILFARGDFECSLYLSLARGQRDRGGKSAFGLQVAEPERSADMNPGDEPKFNYALGPIIERGCYNYRWPYNEFCLHAVDKSCDGFPLITDPSKTGTCSVLSFVRNGVVYQLLRLDPPQDQNLCPELVLTIESPMRLQSFACLNQCNAGNSDEGSRAVGLFTCDAYGVNTKDVAPEDDGFVARFMGVIPCEQHDNAHDTEAEANHPSCAACSRVHWQAKLAELSFVPDVDDSEHEPEASQKRRWRWQNLKLQRFGEKMDHIFKDKDNVTSLPRYRADLQSIGADSGGARVFLASFCLFEGLDSELDSGKPVKAPSAFEQTPSCEEISASVGVGPSSEPGARPATMWGAIFSGRQDNMECVSQLPEARIVGRCLEKILGVDVIPLAATPGPSSPYTAALISNMFLNARVDLKSLFWKTRFLAKVDRLLSRIIKEANTQPGLGPGSPDRRERRSLLLTDVTISTAEETVDRIRDVIGAVTAYLVKDCLMATQPAHVLLPKAPAIGDANDHYDAVNWYYLVITVWYVVKHNSEVEWGRDWDWDWQEVSVKLDILNRRLATLKRGDHLLWGHCVSMRVKHSMLKWLHDESVRSLQDKCKAGIPKGVTAVEVEPSRYTARTELARRIASTDPYRADDEIADRLAFLADELWTDGPAQAHVARLVKRITKRIQDRKFTQTIPFVREGATDGPWELHALCHHSRLVVAHRNMPCVPDDGARADSEQEVEHFRKKLYPFLTTEASLTPCWERHALSARRGFLRSEATAVLASTVVDIFSKDLDYFQFISTDEPATVSAGPASTAQNPNQGGPHVEPTFSYRSASLQVRYNGELVTAETLLAQQLETQEQLASAKGLGRPIDYLRFRPPQKYHPDEFFHSLDDTPDLYTSEKIRGNLRGVPVPQAIREALSGPAMRPQQRRPLQRPRHQRPRQHLGPNAAPSIPTIAGSEAQQDDDEIDSRTRQLLQDILQVGPNNPAVALHDLAVIDLGTPDSTTPVAPHIKFGADTVKKISDSLVDQEVRHRLLFVRASYGFPAPGLLKLLLYVLHPEMVEGFKNHVMKVSRFGRPNVNDGVVAHITLRSWSRSSEDHPPHDHMEEDVIRFPAHLKATLDRVQKRRDARPMGERRGTMNSTIELHDRHGPEAMVAVHDDGKSRPGGAKATSVGMEGAEKEKEGEKDLGKYELRVSSVGISTNEFGDFSKCSVVTDLIDENDLIALGDTMQGIWDSFIHQPQTGRFLVFAAILGRLCERMAREYRQLIKEFYEEMDLDGMFSSTYLNERSETMRKRNGDAELRLSLWSLEALYKMSNTMATSVQTIDLAISNVKKEVQEGPDKRSEELDDKCHTHLEKLERSFSDLSALQIRMERQVELNMRYSSALSAILALRVSQDSYRQNITIQKLTYLTIGCLPIGLSAVRKPPIKLSSLAVPRR
jgi:hypothetical protein